MIDYNGQVLPLCAWPDVQFFYRLSTIDKLQRIQLGLYVNWSRRNCYVFTWMSVCMGQTPQLIWARRVKRHGGYTVSVTHRVVRSLFSFSQQLLWTDQCSHTANSLNNDVKNKQTKHTHQNQRHGSLFNPYMPRYCVNIEAIGLSVLANGRLLKKQKRKHSSTSSLNKGSPSSEVHVSRMPKLHTMIKQNTENQLCVLKYGTVGINGLKCLVE